MRWLALLGVVGCVACTRANPSYGDGDSTGRLDDEGQASFDDSPTDASASISASDDAVTDSVDDSPSDEDATDPTIDSGGSGKCCEPHGGHGCEEPGIEECVCDAQPQCCIDEWAENCVLKATICGAGCPGVDTGVVDEGGTTESSDATSGTSDSATEGASTTDGGGSSSTGGGLDDCCVDGAGCSNRTTQACVCALEGFEGCCLNVWDQGCVDAALEMCPAACVA